MVRLDSPDLVGDIAHRGDRTSMPPPPGQAAQEGTWQGGARTGLSVPPLDVLVAGGPWERRGDLSGAAPFIQPADPYSTRRGRDLKSRWDWLQLAASMPADPIPIASGTVSQLIETGRQIFYGGSLINTAAGGGQTIVTPANPAAGANFTYTNNTGQPQQLVGITAVFTASSAVANRFLQWQIQDSANHNLAVDVNGTAVVASTSVNVDAYIGSPNLPVATGTWQSPLPSGLLVPPGGFVNLATGIQAGDQWSAIVLTFAAVAGAGYAEIRDGMDATGGLIARVSLPAGQATNIPTPYPGILCETGLYLVVSGATVSGGLWVTHLWKYPFTPPGE